MREGKFAAILYPRVSPDGAAVVFAELKGSQSREPQRSRSSGILRKLLPFLPSSANAHGVPLDLWRINVADVATTQLTDFAEDAPYPSWSADGKRVTVIAFRALYEINSDGSRLKTIGEGAYGGHVDVRPK